MPKIKKAFAPIIDLLRANPTAVVNTILAQAEVLASAKKGGSTSASTYLKDVTGETVAILDYYFKRWMPLVGDEAIEFGKKAGSASGFSTMSKAGTSFWTKQQREAKNAGAKILADLEAGKLEVNGIADRKAEIEKARAMIQETEGGFSDKADLLAYLEDAGYELLPQ